MRTQATYLIYSNNVVDCDVYDVVSDTLETPPRDPLLLVVCVPALPLAGDSSNNIALRYMFSCCSGDRTGDRRILSLKPFSCGSATQSETNRERANDTRVTFGPGLVAVPCLLLFARGTRVGVVADRRMLS